MFVDVFVDKQNILALFFGKDMNLSACPKRREYIVGGDRKIEGGDA